MQQTLRWFGPEDTVTLENISQAGATGVVTSLHHIKTGDIWPLEEINKRKKEIESYDLNWSVVESIPLHNDIKTYKGSCKEYINNYKKSVQNVGKAGIKLICYNFMPVIDWTRTNLRFKLPNGSYALRFDMSDFAAYDIYILRRKNAIHDYNAVVREKAEKRYTSLNKDDIDELEKNIISGLPGGEGSYTRKEILSEINCFIKLGTEGYRNNLFSFLQEIIPVAEQSGVKMCIHPDDPPFSLFGLPKVVSNPDDVRKLLAAFPSISNGLTMCVGSYGAGYDNELIKMIKEFGSHIHFAHLRNIIKEPDGSFYESDHLSGDNNMYEIISEVLDEEQNRSKIGRMDIIPMRPDHGHLIGDEVYQKGINPGYSFAGRLKGLGELRGVIYTLDKIKNRHKESQPHIPNGKKTS